MVMKLKLLSLLAVTIFFFSCGKKKEESKVITETPTQKTELGIPTFNYEGLKPLLYKSDDKTYIINFWATWCKPCVEELPYFEKVGKEFQDKNVEVVLVSLDFPNQIESKLIPFIQEHKLESEVVVLDDPKQNVWINAIDPSWSGSIPATIIYNKNQRAFYEQSFDEKSLIEELQKFIN